ncbi:hypothetical protein KM043_016350 [Ampulex compressa]|nr:hypothetical protein KM043_016350 [Ampulex compressa]
MASRAARSCRRYSVFDSEKVAQCSWDTARRERRISGVVANGSSDRWISLILAKNFKPRTDGPPGLSRALGIDAHGQAGDEAPGFISEVYLGPTFHVCRPLDPPQDQNEVHGDPTTRSGNTVKKCHEERVLRDSCDRLYATEPGEQLALDTMTKKARDSVR